MICHYKSRLLKFFPAWVMGFTIGQHVFFRYESVMVGPELRAHEYWHTVQYRKMGYIKFLAKYFYYNIKYGYQDNPLEIEARTYARKYIQG